MSRKTSHLVRRAKELAEFVEQFAAHHDPCTRCDSPHDGGPRLRPHTISGWWQVWSGGLCIALLSDEDVAPLRASANNP